MYKSNQNYYTFNHIFKLKNRKKKLYSNNEKMIQAMSKINNNAT